MNQNLRALFFFQPYEWSYTRSSYKNVLASLQTQASAQIEALSGAVEKFLGRLRIGPDTTLELDSLGDVSKEFMPLGFPPPKYGTRYVLTHFRLCHCPGTPLLESG